MARTTQTPITPSPGGPATTGARTQQRPAAVVTTPGRTRRRPWLIALSIALVCLGGLTAAWLATTTTQTSRVLVLTRDVPAGSTLSSTDLATASLSRDQTVAVVPADRIDSVIGQRATVPLLDGQLLVQDAFGATLTPPAGRSLVGVAVAATQLPSEPLQAGARILLVPTPNPQDDPPQKAPSGTQALVISVSRIPDTDKTVVNVSVPESVAPILAAQAATGRLAVVLLTPGAGE